MQYLVRKELSANQSEFEDLDYDAKELSFGSSDRCLVSLGLPAGCQLVIRKTGDGTASYRADKGLSVSRNGEPSAKGSLALGDTLIVEGYELSIVAAPMGFDLAIQVQSSGTPIAAKPRFATDLAQSAISVRMIGYIALALILVFFLVLPTLGLFDDDVSMLNRLT